MNEWISVKDRLPERNMKCLCVSKFYGYTMVHILSFQLENEDMYGRIVKNAFWEYDSEAGEYCFDGILYWMPVPELPEC